MRVNDITKPSRLLREAAWGFDMLLKWAIKSSGKRMSAQLEYALEWLGRNVTRTGNKTAEELAEGWMKASEKADLALSEVIAVGREAAKRSGVPDEVLDDAVRLAGSRFRGRLIPRIRDATQAAQMWWGASFSLMNTVLTTVGVLKPVGEMLYYIYEAYQKNEEGHPEYQGKKLQYIVQFEINKCLESVVGILAGRATIAWVLGPRGIQMLGPLGWGPIGKAFNLLNPAAQAAFQAWFLSPPGQESFAKWLVGTAVIPFTDTKLPFGPSFREAMDFIGGHVVKTGYDAILRAMDSDKAQQPPKAPEVKTFQRSSDIKDLTHGFKN